MIHEIGTVGVAVDTVAFETERDGEGVGSESTALSMPSPNEFVERESPEDFARDALRRAERIALARPRLRLTSVLRLLGFAFTTRRQNRIDF